MDQHGMYGTVWNVIYEYAICTLFVVGSISASLDFRGSTGERMAGISSGQELLGRWSQGALLSTREVLIKCWG